VTTDGVLVLTGASGFIGGRIVEILHLTGAHKIRAAFRRWPSCARIGRFPVELVHMDLLNEPEVERALENASAVVHCAQGSREVIERGTANLLAVALKRKVRRFIHLSSTAVYGDATGEIDETHPLRYTGHEYADAKINAEQSCYEFLDKGLPVVILRPPIVYGPHGTDWTINISRHLLAGRWRTLGTAGNGKCNLLFVDDLFRAVMVALEHPQAVGQAFNVNGPEAITWNEYFQRINRSLGLPDLRDANPRASDVRTRLMEPVRALGVYARAHHMDTVKTIAARFDLAKKLMKQTEKTIKATPSRAELSLYSRDVLYRAAKARNLLGFVPKFGVDEGLRITAQWLKHEGFCWTNGSSVDPASSPEGRAWKFSS